MAKSDLTARFSERPRISRSGQRRDIRPTIVYNVHYKLTKKMMNLNALDVGDKEIYSIRDDKHI